MQSQLVHKGPEYDMYVPSRKKEGRKEGRKEGKEEEKKKSKTKACDIFPRIS